MQTSDTIWCSRYLTHHLHPFRWCRTGSLQHVGYPESKMSVNEQGQTCRVWYWSLQGFLPSPHLSINKQDCAVLSGSFRCL